MMRDAGYRERYYMAEFFRMPVSRLEQAIGTEELFGWRVHLRGRND